MSLNTLKKTLGAVAAASLIGVSAQASAAPSFQIDLTALSGALTTDAYTGDGKTGLIDEMQFAVATNTVTLTFSGPTADFALGSTFTFTDVGTVQGSAFLPTGLGTDYEGFNSTWTLQGAFSLTGSGSVTGVTVGGDPILSFIFNPGGSLYLDYVDTDETLRVLDTTSISGDGLVAARAGANVQSASAFTLLASAGGVYPGFWLQPDGTPYLPGLTLALADGNINSTTTTSLGGRVYSIDSNTDGSISLRAVPEPASLALIAMGLLGLAGTRRRSHS